MELAYQQLQKVIRGLSAQINLSCENMFLHDNVCVPTRHSCNIEFLMGSEAYIHPFTIILPAYFLTRSILKQRPCDETVWQCNSQVDGTVFMAPETMIAY